MIVIGVVVTMFFLYMVGLVLFNAALDASARMADHDE